MEVATLEARLVAEIAGFQRNMATADSAIAGTRANLKGLERDAIAAAAALNRVGLPIGEATSTRASEDVIVGGLEKIRDTAIEAKAAMAGLGVSGGVVGVAGPAEVPKFRGTMQYGLLGFLLGESEARRIVQIIRAGTLTAETRGGIEGVFLGVPQTQFLTQEIASEAPNAAGAGLIPAGYDWASRIAATELLRQQMDILSASTERLAAGGIPLGAGGFQRTIGGETLYRQQLADLLESQRAANGALVMDAGSVDDNTKALRELTAALALYDARMSDMAANVERVNGAIPLGGGEGPLAGTGRRVFVVPETGLPMPTGIPNEDLRRMAIFQEQAADKQRLAAAALTGSAVGLGVAASDLEAAARARGGGGGGGGAGLATGLLAGMGFGGGGGIPMPFFGRMGGFGFGRGRRLFPGMAALGSLAGLMGFGAERMIASSLGILGSMGGGLLGGGLLAGGIAGTTAVGMGTDLAGIGQAAGDIRKVSTDLGALQTAIRVYGRNSTQAAQAQAQLNSDLGAFSPVARNAVLAASQTSQSFKTMFDKVTGLAERTGAEIINQAMHVGMKFLPTIGKFAFQNMQIIQHGLQPFFAWLQQKGPQGGLGIFTNLEHIFQNRLPTTIHALTQAAELMAKVIDVAAKQTGGLMQHINAFFTKWNAPSNFGKVSGEVVKLIGLFRTWMGLLGSIIGLTVDLFKPAVGLGRQFAQSLTDIVNKIREWVNASGTQNVLHSLFAAHLQQVKLLGQLIEALIPLLGSVVSAFLQIEAAFASAFNNGLKPIIDAIKWLLQSSFVRWVLGWAGAMWIVYRATAAIGAGFALLTGGSILAGLRGIALGFFGIQTAAVKAQIATDAETASIAEMDAVAAGGGAAGIAGAAGGAGILGRFGGMGALGTAGLFAAGGFLVGGLAKNVIGGHPGSTRSRIGSGAFGALAGAGVGAGIGSIVPGVGTAVGAGIGALIGTVITLTHAVPSLVTQLNRLSATFVSLGRNAKGARQVHQQFASALAQVAQQAKLTGLNVGVWKNGLYSLQPQVASGSQALINFTSKMIKMADDMTHTTAKTRKLYLEIAELSKGLGHLPTKKNIDIFLNIITRTHGNIPIGGDLFAPGAVATHGPQPVNLNLPRNIQMQLAAAQAGHGSITKADAAAYAYYEALLKRHNLTRKQILAIYTAEAQYAPYQTPHSYQHATGSVTGATTGMAMLPTSVQNALQRAQQRAARADVTSPGQMTPAQLQRALAANRALHSEQQQAIQDLIRKASQVNAASAQHAALEREITALTRQQAATQRQITADLKQQHALQVQGRINKILGIGGGGQALSQTGGIQQRERNMFIKALEQVLGGSKHTLAATAAALGVTPGQLARESPAELLRQMRQHGITLDAKSMAELRKIQQAIQIAHKENVRLTPAETRKITNWLQQIQQELSGTSTTASNYIAPSARALVAGLGLTHAQAMALIGRYASYYMHGHRVPTGGAAGGVDLPSGVGGGVQLPPTHHHHHHHHHRQAPSGGSQEVGAMVMTGNVTIHIDAAGKDGAALAREIRSELLKIQRRNTAQTRGNNAGKGLGLA